MVLYSSAGNVRITLEKKTEISQISRKSHRRFAEISQISRKSHRRFAEIWEKNVKKTVLLRHVSTPGTHC